MALVWCTGIPADSSSRSFRLRSPACPDPNAEDSGVSELKVFTGTALQNPDRGTIILSTGFRCGAFKPCETILNRGLVMKILRTIFAVLLVTCTTEGVWGQ